MSDQWISFQEAVTYVEARLNVSNPSSALWDAIRNRRINAGFPGEKDDDPDATASWTDYHLNTRAANMTTADRNALTTVYVPSLMAWIDRLSGKSAPAKAEKTGRPQGTGAETTDAPFVAMMRELLVSQRANSMADAAKKVIAQNPVLNSGNAQQESVVRRLSDLYKKTYDGE
ncbi:hypothetical protein [Mesorhizobium sp. M0895]|uniref:hypothetical protein n=1 Tax=Mesorhizobium sp. M0895 TaxID=2957019 RepID=UPI00333AF725